MSPSKRRTFYASVGALFILTGFCRFFVYTVRFQVPKDDLWKVYAESTPFINNETQTVEIALAPTRPFSKWVPVKNNVFSRQEMLAMAPRRSRPTTTMMTSTTTAAPDYNYEWTYDGDEYINYVANLTKVDLRKLFVPLLNSSERQAVIFTLQGCIELMRNAKISYSIMYGTLIGWYRHGKALIPWDDDVDLAIYPSGMQKPTTAGYAKLMRYQAVRNKTFSKIFGNFSAYEIDENKIKCFSNSPLVSREIKDVEGVTWRWPFSDIFLMQVFSHSTKENFYDVSHADSYPQDLVVGLPHLHTKFTYPFNWVFPLQKSTFEGIEVDIPNQPDQILKRSYELENCQVSSWNHKLEGSVNDTILAKVKCSKLKDIFPLTNLDNLN